MLPSTYSSHAKPQISFTYSRKSLHVRIETARLIICSYKAEDLADSVQLYGCATITKYFDHGQPRTEAEVIDLVRQKGEHYFLKGKPFGLFSIFNRATMTFLGQIDLIPSDEPGTAEIGFILHKRYHGQGLCTEAARVFVSDYIEEINHAYFNSKELPIRKITATVHPQNCSSKAVLEKLGMVLDRFQERFGHPRLWYSLLVPSAITKQKIGA